MDTPKKQKTILLDGFEDKDLSSLVSFIKTHPAVGKDAVFASVTETSLKWTVQEWLEELAKEHAYFTKSNPDDKPVP